MWYEQYNWKENPFSIKASTELIGLEEKKQELVSYIRSGDICFLNGPTGVGKTSLLKWLEHNLPRHKVIYLDAAGIQPGFSITNYLKKQASLFSKLSGKTFPKNTVILVDESQDCDQELLKALKLHWDHNHIKSIVITQINPHLSQFSQSFKDRIGNRIILLEKLTKSQGYDLIKLRTRNHHPFDLSAIEAILEIADGIPRKIIETAEIICMKFSGKKTTLNAFDVQSCFQKPIQPKPIEIPEKIPTPAEHKKKLSPMESLVMQQLATSNKTAQMLALLLKTSEGSIGKQLSNLMKKRLIQITKYERPKEYGLLKE